MESLILNNHNGKSRYDNYGVSRSRQVEAQRAGLVVVDKESSDWQIINFAFSDDTKVDSKETKIIFLI